ncbi:MAG: hybrid sensor histidine kinase/response regulator [Chloroflexota bacterium]|nr:hybrid sensor histidine kinase/response regulator [Chloroflexota bacterium]
MDLSAFYAQFREETADNVRMVADGLLLLERNPADRATLDGVFRAAHTVKGSARLLGFNAVASVAHAMESLLGAMRAGSVKLSPALNDLLLQANDTVLALATAASENRSSTLDTSGLIASLEQAALSEAAAPIPSPPTNAPLPPREDQRSAPAPSVAPGAAEQVPVEGPTVPPAAPLASPAPSAMPPATGSKQRQSGGASVSGKTRATVRVRVDRLDRLLAVAGELTVGQQADSLHIQSLQHLTLLVSQQQAVLQAVSSELDRVRVPAVQRQNLLQHIDELRMQAGELNHLLRSQQEGYLRRSAAHASLVEELEAEVFAARLVPAATIFATLPRAIRELARSLDKQVELELQGEETEADRKVLDALGDPLLHMVRNAVDHGLESAAERVAAGKTPGGRLIIAATADHGQIRIAVTDDGRGMDPHKLRAVAVRKGLIDEATANALTDAEALELIFMPGFSMSPIITDVSGRGVGMDVVRSRMVELGGQVVVDSQVDVGTTITLVLPVSLMTSQVILVEAGKQLWAIPSRNCRGVLRMERESVHRVEGQPLLQYDGKTVPIVALADLLDLPVEPLGNSAQGHALLLAAARPIAVLVDRLVDEREVVIKPLGPLFGTHPVAAGVAPLPDGSLAVVVSTQGLANRTRRARLASPERVRTRRLYRLLIADDSFTTRELLRSILQSAGYEVATAVDGQDALDKLRADGRFDLVVSDVEMPRLDGFGLTAGIRADPRSAHVPVIIVTSLHSDEHKHQGVTAGAQAYIVKSQFDQSNLLAAVRDLLDTPA